MHVSAAVLCLLAGQTVAAPHAPRQDGAVKPVEQDGAGEQEGAAPPAAQQDGVFQLPLFTVAPEEELALGDATKAKRQVPIGLDNVKYGGVRPAMALGVTLEVGNPPQKVIVEPDTGSSQLWLPGATATAGRTGAESVYFDGNASTSLQNLNKISGSLYGKWERVQWDVMSDDVSVGGKSMGKLNFGLGKMDSPHTSLGRIVGIMGLLPHSPAARDKTDFVPQKLLDLKITKTRAFSMALRDKGQGLLTFGGYDTSKFSGPLEKLPIIPNKSNHYLVSVQSVSVTASSGGSSEAILNSQTVSRPLTMGVDSGSPALNLKDDLFDMVARKIQGTPHKRGLKVSCDVVDAGASLDFKMTDSTTVSLPLGDMLLMKEDNDKSCILAIQKANFAAEMWIGGHFLRRSLVVYDPDESCIYVARGADCGSSVVAIDGKMPTDVVQGKCSQEPAAAELPSQAAMTSVAALDDDQFAALLEPRIVEAQE